MTDHDGCRPTLRPAGDRALLLELPDADPLHANRLARALAARLEGLELPAIEDIIPAARSVLVLLRPGEAPPPALLAALEVPIDPEPVPETEGRRIDIPVRYGGEAGPDLEALARLHGLSPSEVIDLHAGALYTVAFLGFMPGFAYLTGLPSILETARLETPRTRVPAGSVAIAGPYTGIYPRATPGGWWILGRTDRRLFDLEASPPSLLEPGDRVRFVPA